MEGFPVALHASIGPSVLQAGKLTGNKKQEEKIMGKSATAKAVEALAEKLVGATVTELPEVSAGDNGDVLLVSGGKWAKGAIPSQLPAVTEADEGDVLKVNSSGEWAKGSILQELPTVTASDVGKILKVNDQGEWVAVLPDA